MTGPEKATDWLLLLLCLQPLAQRAAGHRCLQKRRPRARQATLEPPAGADREAGQANQCVPENCRAFWEQETPATLSCALCPRVPGRISLSLSPSLCLSLSPLLPSLSPSLLFSPLLSSPLISLSLSLSSPLISSPFLLLYLSLTHSLTHSSLSAPLSLSLSTHLSSLSTLLSLFLSLSSLLSLSLSLSPPLPLSLSQSLSNKNEMPQSIRPIDSAYDNGTNAVTPENQSTFVLQGPSISELEWSKR